MAAPHPDRVLDEARDLCARERRIVLAVSGGIDSMSLLDAVARVAHARNRIVIATFDHGTGPAATSAAALVAREAEARGFPVRMARENLPDATENEWRAARWLFLRAVAREHRGRVVTAHTRDDHVETVVMRMLRGSGVRGLAGLEAATGVARPFIDIARTAIVAYAARYGVPFVDDPSNASRAFLRNRVRLDILPAILSVRPGFTDEVLDIARRAVAVRKGLDDVATRVVVPHRTRQRVGTMPEAAGTTVDAASLTELGIPELRMLWQAIAGLAGLQLDRRGVARLAGFSKTAASGQSIPLSGGLLVVRQRDSFVLQRRPAREPTASLMLASELTYGSWHFRALPRTTIRVSSRDKWVAVLPAQSELLVRAWQPGDRIPGARGRERRVKRFFADAGVVGPLREGWPVVLCEGRVVWIPGIHRSQDAVDKSGRPTIVYRCERC